MWWLPNIYVQTTKPDELFLLIFLPFKFSRHSAKNAVCIRCSPVVSTGCYKNPSIEMRAQQRRMWPVPEEDNLTSRRLLQYLKWQFRTIPTCATGVHIFSHNIASHIKLSYVTRRRGVAVCYVAGKCSKFSVAILISLKNRLFYKEDLIRGEQKRYSIRANTRNEMFRFYWKLD